MHIDTHTHTYHLYHPTQVCTQAMEVNFQTCNMSGFIPIFA